MASVRFVVKESGAGIPFLVFEPLQPDQALPRGVFAFNLAPSTSLQAAQDLARTLNKEVESVSFTSA